jgi:hypothetical protein
VRENSKRAIKGYVWVRLIEKMKSSPVIRAAITLKVS